MVEVVSFIKTSSKCNAFNAKCKNFPVNSTNYAGSFLKPVTTQQPFNNQLSQVLLMASKLVSPQQETAHYSDPPKEHSFHSLKEHDLVLASDSHNLS